MLLIQPTRATFTSCFFNKQSIHESKRWEGLSKYVIMYFRMSLRILRIVFFIGWHEVGSNTAWLVKKTPLRNCHVPLLTEVWKWTFGALFGKISCSPSLQVWIFFHPFVHSFHVSCKELCIVSRIQFLTTLNHRLKENYPALIHDESASTRVHQSQYYPELINHHIVKHHWSSIMTITIFHQSPLIPHKKSSAPDPSEWDFGGGPLRTRENLSRFLSTIGNMCA